MLHHGEPRKQGAWPGRYSSRLVRPSGDRERIATLLTDQRTPAPRGVALAMKINQDQVARRALSPTAHGFLYPGQVNRRALAGKRTPPGGSRTGGKFASRAAGYGARPRRQATPCGCRAGSPAGRAGARAVGLPERRHGHQAGKTSRLHPSVVLARRSYIRDQNCCCTILVTARSTRKLYDGYDAAIQHIGAEYSLCVFSQHAFAKVMLLTQSRSAPS